MEYVEPLISIPNTQFLSKLLVVKIIKQTLNIVSQRKEQTFLKKINKIKSFEFQISVQFPFTSRSIKHITSSQVRQKCHRVSYSGWNIHSVFSSITPSCTLRVSLTVCSSNRRDAGVDGGTFTSLRWFLYVIVQSAHLWRVIPCHISYEHSLYLVTLACLPHSAIYQRHRESWFWR